MQKKILFYLGSLVLALSIFAFNSGEYKDTEAEEAVKKLILKSYVHGAFNELNPDEMRKGFHPDFAIFSAFSIISPGLGPFSPSTVRGTRSPSATHFLI